MKNVSEFKCIKCQVVQPVTNYYFNNVATKSRLTTCKSCTKVYTSNRQKLIDKISGAQARRLIKAEGYKLPQVVKVAFDLRSVLRGWSDGSTLIEMLGCSVDQFKAHLEQHFEDWMTYDNFINPDYSVLKGGWDIELVDENGAVELDNIIPRDVAVTAALHREARIQKKEMLENLCKTDDYKEMMGYL